MYFPNTYTRVVSLFVSCTHQFITKERLELHELK